MPVLKYEYTPLFRLDPASNEYFAVYVPFVPIRLSMNHRISQSIINCLFDTGADINLFPATMAISLGRITFAEHFKKVCLHGKKENAYIALEY